MILSRSTRSWILSFIFIVFVGFTLLVPAVGQTNQPSGKGAQGSHKVVLYTGIGPELTRYDVDVDAASLTKRESVTLPGSITEAAFHPSRKYVYVVWGNVHSPTDNGQHEHGISAFRLDPESGALSPYGQSVSLPAGPGYVSYITVDVPGTHVLASVTDPPWLSVFQINSDGTIGAEVKSATPLDFANHPHQVRVDPSNKTVILVTRGNVPVRNKPEDPGALKLFSYNDGALKNTETIAPNGGYHYQARHLDFHPSGKWDFVSLEAQQKLLVYKRQPDGTLDPEPLFTKDTLIQPDNIRPGQILGTVRVDHTGKFLYLANRASGGTNVDGKRVFVGGENSIAVFSINQETGEPSLIQHIDTEGLHARTISFDPSGKILVAYNISKLAVRDGDSTRDVLPNLAVFRVGSDGKLEFVRKYDVGTGDGQDWMGFSSLP